MGVTKSDSFTANQNELAIQFKALGHPARIAIIEFLLKAESCICNDIVDELPLAQPTISQHSKELKSAGIIKGTIEGKSICYCIDEENLEGMIQNLLEMKQTILDKKNKCC